MPNRRAELSEARHRTPALDGCARWHIAIALVLLALAATLDVAAAAPERRILVIDRGSPDLARRVQAEADHVGFEVVAAEEPAATSDADTLARHRALAIVRVSSDDGVEITIAGERPEMRALARREGEGPAFAIRVVEELRGRLVELALLPTPTPPGAERATSAPPADAPATSPLPVAPAPVPSPPVFDEPRRTSRPEPRFWIRGGAGGLLPAGELGPTGLAILGVGGEPFDREWGIAAVAMLPVTENETSEPEGEVEASVNVFAGEIVHFAGLGDERWFGTLGAGGGVLVLGLRSETQAPAQFETRTDSLVAGVYWLHAGVGHRVARWLRLRLTLSGGVSAPRPVVRIDDRDVAAWGRAFGGLSLVADLGVATGSGEVR